jgi:hypothetical protein
VAIGVLAMAFPFVELVARYTNPHELSGMA